MFKSNCWKTPVLSVAKFRPKSTADPFDKGVRKQKCIVPSVKVAHHIYLTIQTFDVSVRGLSPPVAALMTHVSQLLRSLLLEVSSATASVTTHANEIKANYF